MSRIRTPSYLLLIAILCSTGHALSGAQNVETFAPVEEWRKAVLTGDAAALKSLYIMGAPLPAETTNWKTAEDDVDFWTRWKAKGLTELSLEISAQKRQANVHTIIIHAELSVKEEMGLRKYYVVIGQGWLQQGGDWRVRAVSREDVTRLKMPAERLHLYPEDADARSDIAKAVRKAHSSHKRIILEFGNNICTNCDVLEAAFKSAEIAPTFDPSYELVHINIGGLDKNLDVAKQYGVPLPRGFPALAVLDSDGKLVFSQKRGEFANVRWMAPEDVLDFLNKWKPSATKN